MTITVLSNNRKTVTQYKASDILMIDQMTASDLYGYDQEKLDDMDLSSYTRLTVIFFRDGTQATFKDEPQIIFS